MEHTILLTGASGFVGQNIINELPNARFVVFEHRSKVPDSDRIIHRISSFEEDIPTCEIWINLAGKAHDLSRVQSDEAYVEANVAFTQRVFAAFQQHKGAKLFIQLSSVKAIADDPAAPINEDSQENPKTIYGKTKLQADRFLQEASVEIPKRVIILRPAMIYGPGNKGNLNALFSYCKSGLPYVLARFNGQRSYLSISNMLHIVEQCIHDESISSGVYCASDRETVRTNDLVQWIYDVLGLKPRMIAVPRFLVRVVARAGDYLPIPINSDTLKKIGTDYVVDSQKIQNLLKSPLPIASQEGLKNTLRHFKQML